ncbi:MAG: succinate dehydrogenase, cytochrome b556 subunit [Hyphomicrobiales bacterium]
MSDANSKAQRPLSPHLQIYKPSITMVMSVVHRVTGAGLYFGTILMAWWLMSVAGGEHYYELTRTIFGSFIGRLVLFGYTWALIHHMLGGIRHFIWDTGAQFERGERDRLAFLTLAGSVSITLLIWLIGYAVR